MSTAASDDRLQALLEEYGHVLRRAIRRVAPREMDLDVDDIEQEARLRVWRALEQDTVLEQPASFLYRVAVNATLNAVRKRRALREEVLDAGAEEGPSPVASRQEEGAHSPERYAAGREQLAEVRAAMARLQPDRRRALGLYLLGFTTAEIGGLCGWSEARARNLAYRGRADLRRLLKREGEVLGPVEAT